jgi:hypothetical protein
MGSNRRRNLNDHRKIKLKNSYSVDKDKGKEEYSPVRLSFLFSFLFYLDILILKILRLEKRRPSDKIENEHVKVKNFLKF